MQRKGDAFRRTYLSTCSSRLRELGSLVVALSGALVALVGTLGVLDLGLEQGLSMEWWIGNGDAMVLVWYQGDGTYLHVGV